MFLFASSTLNALRRADRAERIADTQRQHEERERRALQEGAEHIRHVLVLVSNGNYRARVARVAHPLLWQIGSTLNTFIGRLYRLEYESYTLQRESRQAQRIAEAVQLMRRGRQPIWPVPSGLPMDTVIVALAQLEHGSAGGQGVQAVPFTPTYPPQRGPASGGVASLPDWQSWLQRPWDQDQPGPPRAEYWPGEESGQPP
jgi:hypothetical protein